MPTKPDLIVDSFISELAVKSLKKSRFEKIGSRKLKRKYYRGFKVHVAIAISTKVLLYVDCCG